MICVSPPGPPCAKPAAVALLLLASCAAPEHQPASLRSLLARGAAHAEIDQWNEARELFRAAVELAPDEPAAAYNLALASFRTGDRETARTWLEHARPGAPPALGARLEMLRGKLAYEEGRGTEELAAYRRAADLVPEEAAYVHALAQLHLRLGDLEEHGRLAEEAHRLWPENAFLSAETALLRLQQPDHASRRRGLTLLEALAVRSSRSEVAAYLEKGRRELEAEPPPSRVPRALRIALNLLRPTKIFQADMAELQARLEPRPLREPALPAVERAAPAPSPEVHFAAAALVPDLPLASGERVLAAALFDDSTPRRPGGERDAGIAIASDRRLYVLGPEAETFQPLAEISAEVHQLLSGDLDDDERMELLLLTATGLRRWGREESAGWTEIPHGTEPGAGGGLRRGLLLDFEHDGDLDLLAIGPQGDPVLVRNRGEAGLGAPEPAPLPGELRLLHLTSSDLDADADQDLVLASRGELLVLRNWRQGEYALHSRLSLPEAGSPHQLLALDYDADGHMDIVALLSTGIAFWRGDGTAHLHPDPAALHQASRSHAGSPTHLGVSDLDLDGDPDLLLDAGRGSDATAHVVLINDGHGHFMPRGDLVAEPGLPVRGTVALDLDGDRDPDLLSWTDSGALRSFEGRGAEGQGWLALRLRAPGRKVPRDARGVRLEVVAGDRSQWLEPRRPNLVLGLGQSQPALVKATWPNGISEYLFEPHAGTEHTLELSLRVEGSCPFLYAFDGQELRFVTDILGLAPVGMLATANTYVPADPEEYLRLPSWVKTRDGTLELVITEELREILILDQAELVAVDAEEGVEVYNGEQWLPEPIRGLELRLMTPFAPPVSVRDHRGREVLEAVRQLDELYLTNHHGRQRYQGAVPPHQLTVELPATVASAEHPALLLVGWLHWGNTSTNVARAQDPLGGPVFPFLEVPDGSGGWRRTPTPVGLPAGKTKPVVIDLTGVIDPADPRLRITTDFEVYWDLIAAAVLLPTSDIPHRLHHLPPASAELRWSGFSRWFRNAANGPFLFDYQDRRPYPWRSDPEGRPVVISWQEHEGFYTAFGSVERQLARADDWKVVLGSGEELRLTFDVASLPPLPSGWRRTFFLHSEGWEKDGDPNVSCSRTVEPLPYRGMVHDPCSGRSTTPAVIDPSRSRWVARDRLEQRVEAWIDRAPEPRATGTPE